MKMRMIPVLLLLALLAPSKATAAEETRIDRWLVLGPAEPLAGGAGLDADALLDYDFLEPGRIDPGAGGVEWGPGRRLEWLAGSARFAGTPAKRIVYLAVFLEARRWLQADLNLDSSFPVRVYLDCETVTRSGAAGKSVSPLTLQPGKHLLLVKGVLPAQGSAAAQPAAAAEAGKGLALQAALALKPAFKGSPPGLSLEGRRPMSMDDVLYAVSITDVSLAPDGRRVAVMLSQLERGAKSARRWLEVLDAASGDRLFTSQGLAGMDNFHWLGGSRRFAFTSQENGLTRFCRYDLEERSIRVLLAGVEGFSSWWWADDGSFAVYASGEGKGEDKPYRHVRRLDDRFRVPEARQALTLFFPASGARQPLAGFDDDFSQVRISPDSGRLLLISYVEDAKTRPYHRNRVVLHELASGKREKLLDDPWIEDFAWAPDSRRLLLLGGPSAFAGLGSTLPKESAVNDFDHQLYVFDVRTRQAEAVSRAFAPALGEAFWQSGDTVLLKATDQDHERLYRCSLAQKRFVRLESGCEAVESVGWSRSGRIVYAGSGLGSPQKLFVLNPGGAPRLLKDYNRERFAGVRFGRSENWSFKTKEGRTIGGFLCFPPDFDPARLWPCIVNYYGGTTPIGRNFGGRYPKDWYAANGYVVCVLQPSGAIGYGQEFSSAHVNDWGEITSEEIIQGMRELLRSRPYIDNRRVGAIGASYGGFLTMVLATRTDLFAGLVSHAGISSLSSYWGGGDWGYGYSGVATANSFPWNRKDIYVGHSPLFMAERVSRPLLLLHGQEDNNVPPGESYQMFAALKLLGKEVALVTFPGQQHFVLTPPQRIRWLQTIMAWFDRWLKGEPEWWNELYPEEK